MKSRIIFPILLLAIAASACATSQSGDAPEPSVSGEDSASAAGLAAMSTESIDPATCEGVLGGPPDTHTLELQALTDSGQAGNAAIDSMCSAVYETSVPGDPFLTVALIGFTADDSARAHYELLKDVFVTQGVAISEVDSADEGLLDRVSALIDSDGIGRTTVLRQKNWLATVSVGPTTDQSPWTAADLRLIGASIIDRAQS